MKTFKSTIVLLGTLLFFSACVEKPHDHHDDDDGLPNMDVVDEPEIIISVNDADRLFKNYGAERAKVLEEIVNSSNDLETPYIATRFVTVDYADLKQYVEEKTYERMEYVTIIKMLTKKREEFLRQKREKMNKYRFGENFFGVVNKTIVDRAKEKGFSLEF